MLSVSQSNVQQMLFQKECSVSKSFSCGITCLLSIPSGATSALSSLSSDRHGSAEVQMMNLRYRERLEI